jgi:hypothetical protein
MAVTALRNGLHRQARPSAIVFDGSLSSAAHAAVLADPLHEPRVLVTAPGVEVTNYPGGHRLRACARLLGSGLGVRVLHVAWGDFDTHADHRGRHDYQLQQLDAAVSAFCLDLEDLGLADSTLVATASEFGRRPAADAGGTDHGTASCMLLAGPVAAGRHGEAPSLGDLDEAAENSMRRSRRSRHSSRRCRRDPVCTANSYPRCPAPKRRAFGRGGDGQARGHGDHRSGPHEPRSRRERSGYRGRRLDLELPRIRTHRREAP